MTNVLGDSVSVIDATARRVTETIVVGTNPEAVVIDPEAEAAYVACSDGTVWVIDTRTAAVTGQLTVGGTPKAFALDPDSGTVFVVDPATESLIILR